MQTLTDTVAAQPAPEQFLGSISNEKVRRSLAALTQPHAYRWDTLFPKVDGLGAAGEVHRRVRMLRSIEPRLDVLLYPGEQVEFVTKGTLNSWAEQYFMGIWSLVINRTVFLFTNYRVILLNSDGKGRAKSLMWQIPYDRLGKFKTSGVSGTTTFKLASGAAYRFVGVPRADRKRLREYVASRLDSARSSDVAFPSHSDRDPLCPLCATPTPPKARACAECNEPFVHPRVPALLSLLVPGLGDLYLGHRTMAVMEFIGFAFLLLVAAGMMLSGTSQDILTACIIVAVANGVDAAMTYHVARKGVLSRRLAWRG
ncbi:MAG TPA: PH domain-containing protein [Phycisphaerales bacterium]|nr:PH domain-containing protein [Phycisphaerales bacterium]